MNDNRFPHIQFNRYSSPKRIMMTLGAWIIQAAILIAIGAGLVWAALDGLDRQIAYESELRAARCASFGENPTKEQRAYCTDLGV